MCRFFQWADQLPVDVSERSSPPQVDMLNNYISRPKLQRQFAVLENWHLWTFTLIYNIIIIITFVCKLCLYVINFVICALENVCWYFFYKNFPLRLNYLLKTGLTWSLTSYVRHFESSNPTGLKPRLTGLTVLPHWFSDKSLFFLYISAISPGWLAGTFTPLQHTHLS